jgi:hypothetical protein
MLSKTSGLQQKVANYARKQESVTQTWQKI